jgi:Flp pilus assembly protein TadG
VSPRANVISSHLIQRLGSFARSEDGTVLVLWAMFLAVALGFLALSFDLGRVASTQSELQSYADQVALAAAGELDGRSDAITRATAAASGLVSDWQTYATGANPLAGAENYTLTFLSTLPTADTTPITATTMNPALARYVRVQVLDRSVVTGFAGANAALTGRAGTNAQVNVAATATAGMTSWACDVTPLMFCVPNASWRASANIGNQILLRSSGGQSAWLPGNFGFMDVTEVPIDTTGPCNGLNGANLYECLVGAERGITGCIRTDTFVLQTQPGQRNGLAAAFNMRFDIYQGNLQQKRTNSSYRPAANTVQGTRGTGNPPCRGNNPPASNAMALPRDTNITGGNRFGNGSWNRTGYVTTNHGGVYPAGTSATSTRYQMYLAEIAAARLRTAPNNVPLPTRNETGAPQCHSGVSPDLERRTVIAAAIDCSTIGNGGGRTTVAPLEYVKIFLTEPVGIQGNEADIYGEVIGSAGGIGSGATTGAFNDFVQLYR